MTITTSMLTEHTTTTTSKDDVQNRPMMIFCGVDVAIDFFTFPVDLMYILLQNLKFLLHIS